MAILTIVVAFIIATLSKIAADEAKAWLPAISSWLLHIALLRLPSDQRERFKEEWSADLLEFPGEVSRTIRALGMCLAACRMRIASNAAVEKSHQEKHVFLRKSLQLAGTFLCTLSIAFTTRDVWSGLHSGGGIRWSQIVLIVWTLLSLSLNIFAYKIGVKIGRRKAAQRLALKIIRRSA